VASTITALSPDGFPTEHATSIEWARAGTELLLQTVRGLSDEDLDGPSGLPDWSRRHVCAHLARNAEALGRLLTWARTGVETPMYPSPEARDADIEEGAQAAAADLRADLDAACETFLTECEDLPETAWSATVRSRTMAIPASAIPWYRAREVWIHTADLDVGVGFDAFPPDIASALITELATGLSSRGAVDLRLVATDLDREWTVGSGATVVEASTAELSAWLTGRATRTEAELPPWM
jgi:maleylpyruvate isomerase